MSSVKQLMAAYTAGPLTLARTMVASSSLSSSSSSSSVYLNFKLLNTFGTVFAFSFLLIFFAFALSSHFAFISSAVCVCVCVLGTLLRSRFALYTVTTFFAHFKLVKLAFIAHCAKFRYSVGA